MSSPRCDPKENLISAIFCSSIDSLAAVETFATRIKIYQLNGRPKGKTEIEIPIKKKAFLLSIAFNDAQKIVKIM